jgi:four helix bundle protein
VRNHQELACWQLSARLRDELIPILDAISFPKDLDLCRDLARSARSAPANISEGFGQSTRTFHRHLRIAIGSLRESGEHLDEALTRRYVTPEQHVHFQTLATRARKAADRLAQYLDSLAPKRPVKPVKSVSAVLPVKPDQPIQPLQPVKPIQPLQPVKPLQPAQPDKPLQPAQPLQPLQPAQPPKPDQPA